MILCGLRALVRQRLRQCERHHRLVQQVSLGTRLAAFHPANLSVFADVHEGQPDQPIDGVAVPVIEMVAVFHRVAAFHAGAFLVQVLKTLGVTRNLREIAQIRGARQVTGIADAFFRTAVRVSRTVFGMKDRLAFAVAAFGRTSIKA